MKITTLIPSFFSKLRLSLNDQKGGGSAGYLKFEGYLIHVSQIRRAREREGKDRFAKISANLFSLCRTQLVIRK